MRAWKYTMIDLAVLGAVYAGSGLLLGGNPTLAGYATAVAAYTLLKTYKEQLG